MNRCKIAKIPPSDIEVCDLAIPFGTSHANVLLASDICIILYTVLTLKAHTGNIMFVAGFTQMVQGGR